jgi:hypothetical protein
MEVIATGAIEEEEIILDAIMIFGRYSQCFILTRKWNMSLIEGIKDSGLHDIDEIPESPEDLFVD